MQMLCETVRELPAHIRKEWDESEFREFSIGYHVGDDPLCFQEHLNPETTSMAAELGAGIGIALYQAFRTSSDENVFQLQPIYGKVVADQKTSTKSNRLYIVCTLSLISLNEQPHLLHKAICR